MQFLVVTRRRMDVFPAEMWTPELIEAESQQVRTMFAAGTVRSIWRRKDMPGAAMLIEAASEDEARAAQRLRFPWRSWACSKRSL